MRIVGFNLTKVLAQRKDSYKGKLQVDQNINIKNVSEDKISITEDKVLKINFGLVINYSNEYAKLEFEGNVLIIPEKDELKEFTDAWKNKKIPDKYRINLFNFIMNKCNLKALSLEEEMALPFHVPMPRISPDNQKSG